MIDGLLFQVSAYWGSANTKATPRPRPRVPQVLDSRQSLSIHSYHHAYHLTLAQNTLTHPDERQLSRGIKFTDVPVHLQSMVDSLVWESTRTEEGYVHQQSVYL